MSRILVDYLGQRLGVLAEARGAIYFEYDSAFLASGHELSPLHLPLGPGVRTRDAAPSFRLPGLFEDSLPDLWGRCIMMEAFRARQIPEHAVTPLMMLSYVGRRAMGALVYTPEFSIPIAPSNLSLSDLNEAAQNAERSGPIDLSVLADAGSSAGGARPKALVGIHDDDPARIVAGASDLPAGFSAWIVKFETNFPLATGPLEEACARMARAAGLDVPETRLMETRHGGVLRRHFAVRRFDREGPLRVHHHTLASLCHTGGGDLDYATLLRVTRRLTRDEREVWRAYRRAVFNVYASNRDDHGKNHGFLYRDRQWRLGPAYDLTFSGPRQLPERGMAVLGERSAMDKTHLLRLAAGELLDRAQAEATIEEVRAAIRRWPEFADQAKVPSLATAEVGALLRQAD